ncbi:MliC family protein [Marinomonas rhizomae]|uniref:Membrane-bound inhibitor of C-type lysozyme n=1 Tax=Marinomonas rhizomae TaxID=491948 RepID=A0A366ITE5_9GAMM|nr:MliC family protein [Marinomonas rhizomae]RBP78056.1 membrane-bound inhibitor of C-type lysozyme [Marinomonas rhizomae]
MRIKKLLLQSVLIGTSLLCLTACSSINKELTSDDLAYEIEDIDQTNSADYLCENTPLNIFFHAEQAQLSWKDKTYLLTQAISASGAYYLGEGLSFWIQDTEAELEFNDMKVIHCSLVRIKS